MDERDIPRTHIDDRPIQWRGGLGMTCEGNSIEGNVFLGGNVISIRRPLPEPSTRWIFEPDTEHAYAAARRCGSVPDVTEIEGQPGTFTFLGRVRMAWRLLRGKPAFAGFAEPLFLYGGNQTLTQKGHLDVDIHDRRVDAVWFRGVQLPFITREIDDERARANRALAGEGPLDRIAGIAFSSE
jgi:hypothetical protein